MRQQKAGALAAAVVAAVAIVVSLVGFPVVRTSGGGAARHEGSAQGHPSAGRDDATRAEVGKAYGKLPLSFEANQGQSDPGVGFLSRGNGYSLFLTSTEAVFSLRGGAAGGGGSDSAAGGVMRMQLLGSSPDARGAGLEALPGTANYLLGSDRSKWRSDVPTYAKVAYQGVYPGVDVVYYGNQQELEYDFVVAPGADPAAIALGFAGAERLEIDAAGELLVHVKGGALRQRRPVIYQTIGGARREVSGRYSLRGPHQVGFQVGSYDPTQPLIIDPVLVYATYLGGSGSDKGLAIAVAKDISGGVNAYVAGITGSSDFPTTAGSYDGSCGECDLYHRAFFVTKLNPTGSAFVYSTYFGAARRASLSPVSIAVDSTGAAHLAGHSYADVPVVNSSRSCQESALDAFVAKFNSAGSALIYSTCLGGSADDVANGIAVDARNNAYVTGSTRSADFPTKRRLRACPGAPDENDAFVTKLTPTGALVYSTCLGEYLEDVGRAIAVDSSENAYITGTTTSDNFPKKNNGRVQEGFGGGLRDVFVTKLSSKPAILYSTLLGGMGDEVGQGVAVDSSGAAHVTGWTMSVDFPTANAFQPSPGNPLLGIDNETSGSDAFVTKLSSGPMPAIVYSTYLGGYQRLEMGNSIATDPSGTAYVTGKAMWEFPAVNGDCTLGGAFIAKFSPAGAPFYVTCYGNNGNGITADASGAAYVVGEGSVPATPGAYQTSVGGDGRLPDAWVLKLK